MVLDLVCGYVVGFIVFGFMWSELWGFIFGGWLMIWFLVIAIRFKFVVRMLFFVVHLLWVLLILNVCLVVVICFDCWAVVFVCCWCYLLVVLWVLMLCACVLMVLLLEFGFACFVVESFWWLFILGLRECLRVRCALVGGVRYCFALGLLFRCLDCLLVVFCRWLVLCLFIIVVWVCFLVFGVSC